MLHQSLRWRLMLPIWSRLIVSIKNIIDRFSIKALFPSHSFSSLGHFIHELLKLVLNNLGFLLQFDILKRMGTSFIMVDFFYLVDVMLGIGR